jgi:c-di-GMP-binding flagellar brake protein YcgR
MPAPHVRVNRKLTRYTLDKRVRITVRDESASAVLHGRTCDISEGGLCALVSGKLKQGSIVFLEVSGLEEGSLSLTATVRHARGFYYGFEFAHMDDKQYHLLVKMITRNAAPRVHSRHESPAQ